MASLLIVNDIRRPIEFHAAVFAQETMRPHLHVARMAFERGLADGIGRLKCMPTAVIGCCSTIGAVDMHPVHLHRHSFELVSMDGNATRGVVKDVVDVMARTKVEVDLLADNPGAVAVSLPHAVTHGFRLHDDAGICRRRPATSPKSAKL